MSYSTTKTLGIFNFRKEAFVQVMKFILTGAANTAIDFIILNILLFLFGVTSVKYAIFKTIAFLLALTNSYFLNKYWVFEKRVNKNSILRERLSFVGLSTASLLLNSAVSSWVFAVLGRTPDMFSPIVAANAGAVAGVVVVFILNFVFYKFIVFA